MREREREREREMEQNRYQLDLNQLDVTWQKEGNKVKTKNSQKVETSANAGNPKWIIGERGESDLKMLRMLVENSNKLIFLFLFFALNLKSNFCLLIERPNPAVKEGNKRLEESNENNTNHLHSN
jgi:hypothetical protein